MAKKVERYFIELNGRKIPVQFIRERRRSVRFAIGQKAVLVRFPSVLDSHQEKMHLQRLKSWLESVLQKQEGLLDHLAGKQYQSGDQITIGGRKFELKIELEDRKTMAGKLNGRTIQIKIPKDADDLSLSQNIKRLLSKIIAQEFLGEIRQRVEALNEKHFGKNIKDVKLRYHTSSWGKCSSDGSIILSTRLLFAPPPVIDYVIIHELAHLEFFDHSPKFWSLVYSVMPDYKEKQKWLKENSYQCDF